MAENDLTKVARIAACAAQGVITKDANGNQKIIKPTGNANYLDLTDISFGGNTGGGNSDSTSGGTNPTAAGANYYAGSLANGEITKRYFEWGGTDDPTKSNTITFKDPQGSKFNENYDGIQLLGHIQKTVITQGVAGTVTDLPLHYDTNNAAKTGHYTTSASYPVYINNSSFSVGSNTSVPIIGIGENLGGKNIKAPSISLTLNSDMTLTLTHEKGYNNDGANFATGVEYQFIVDTIATYSVQKTVSQLPIGTTLFSGLIGGPAKLADVDIYFDNIGDKLKITIDNYLYSNEVTGSTYGLPASSLNCPTEFTVLRKDLIIGNKIPIPIQFSTNSDSLSFSTKQDDDWRVTGQTVGAQKISLSPSYINVEEDSLEVVINYSWPDPFDSSRKYTASTRIKSITTV